MGTSASRDYRPELSEAEAAALVVRAGQVIVVDSLLPPDRFVVLLGVPPLQRGRPVTVLRFTVQGERGSFQCPRLPGQVFQDMRELVDELRRRFGRAASQMEAAMHEAQSVRAGDRSSSRGRGGRAHGGGDRASRGAAVGAGAGDGGGGDGSAGGPMYSSRLPKSSLSPGGAGPVHSLAPAQFQRGSSAEPGASGVDEAPPQHSLSQRESAQKSDERAADPYESDDEEADGEDDSTRVAGAGPARTGRGGKSVRIGSAGSTPLFGARPSGGSTPSVARARAAAPAASPSRRVVGGHAAPAAAAAATAAAAAQVSASPAAQDVRSDERFASAPAAAPVVARGAAPSANRAPRSPAVPVPAAAPSSSSSSGQFGISKADSKSERMERRYRRPAPAVDDVRSDESSAPSPAGAAGSRPGVVVVRTASLSDRDLNEATNAAAPVAPAPAATNGLDFLGFVESSGEDARGPPPAQPRMQQQLQQEQQQQQTRDDLFGFFEPTVMGGPAAPPVAYDKKSVYADAAYATETKQQRVIRTADDENDDEQELVDEAGYLMPFGSESARDKVNFGAYAPSRIERSTLFDLSVWAFLKQEIAAVAEAAAREGASQTGDRKEVALARGTRLTVVLRLPEGLEAAAPRQPMVWNGSMTRCKFTVSCLPTCATGPVKCRALVQCGVTIASLQFSLNVADGALSGPWGNSSPAPTAVHSASYSASLVAPAPLDTAVWYVQRIWSTFAEPDELTVFEWKLEIEKVNPEVHLSLDVLDRRRADADWLVRARQPATYSGWDMVALFWSPAAATDPSVDAEWRGALACAPDQRLGDDFVQVVVLGPDAVMGTPTAATTTAYSGPVAIPEELSRVHVQPLPRKFRLKGRARLPPSLVGGWDEDDPDAALDPSSVVDRADLEMLEEVGHGSFGVVHRGRVADRQVAVKVVPVTVGPDAIKGCLSEALAMERVGKHPNVVQFLGACLNHGELLLVTEFADGGSLERRVRRLKSVSWRELLRLAAEAARGLAHVHAQRLVHRDLALRNLLLDGPAPSVRVCDFGLSRFLVDGQSSGVSKDSVGPIRWMAPESLLSSAFSPASDSWAFGIVLWELLSGGALPFCGLSNSEVAAGVADGSLGPAALLSGCQVAPHVRVPTSAGVGDGASSQLWFDRVVSLLMECCDRETGRRPSAAQLARVLSDWSASAPDDERAYPFASEAPG